MQNYTEYNQQWNVFSVFDPSKYTHTWSSGHTHTPGAVDTHTPGAVDTHTPGAVDTHTHLEQWTHTHLEQWTHTPGAVNTHTHTPGAVDTHTHTHTWSNGHTHTHLEQWTHTHTHTPGAMDTHTHTWSGQSGEQFGVRCLAQGSHLSCGQFLPEPRLEPTISSYKSNALSTRDTTARAASLGQCWLKNSKDFLIIVFSRPKILNPPQSPFTIYVCWFQFSQRRQIRLRKSGSRFLIWPTPVGTFWRLCPEKVRFSADEMCLSVWKCESEGVGVVCSLKRAGLGIFLWQDGILTLWFPSVFQTGRLEMDHKRPQKRC